METTFQLEFSQHFQLQELKTKNVATGLCGALRVLCVSNKAERTEWELQSSLPQ